MNIRTFQSGPLLSNKSSFFFILICISYIRWFWDLLNISDNRKELHQTQSEKRVELVFRGSSLNES